MLRSSGHSCHASSVRDAGHSRQWAKGYLRLHTVGRCAVPLIDEINEASVFRTHHQRREVFTTPHDDLVERLREVNCAGDAHPGWQGQLNRVVVLARVVNFIVRRDHDELQVVGVTEYAYPVYLAERTNLVVNLRR